MLAGTQPLWEELVHPESCPSHQSRCAGVSQHPLPLACLSWLLLGCSEGTAAPIPAAPHLPAHPSTGAIVFSPPVLPILHSISPETLTTAPWSPWLPLSNDLPFLLPSSLSSCLPLQNWGGFSSGLRRGATDRLGLHGLMLKEDLDGLASRTQAGSWQLC